MDDYSKQIRNTSALKIGIQIIQTERLKRKKKRYEAIHTFSTVKFLID